MSRTYRYSDFLDRFENGKERAKEIAELSDSTFTLRPGADKWSTEEICRHIIQFNKLYQDQIGQLLKSHPKSPEDTPAEFRVGLSKSLFIKWMEPPYKMKIGTLKPLYPENMSGNINETRTALIRNQQELITLVEMMRDEGINADRLKGKHPLFSLLSLTVTEMLALIDAHQRRHFWQISQTLEMFSNAQEKE
ncbi:MAG: DinB family protein [Balneolaceae bacterium]|nr:DinB family protein [Balneolaceae bacterium]MCH8549152.1 DinB family protein [Balneolaceae bacterium]